MKTTQFIFAAFISGLLISTIIVLNRIDAHVKHFDDQITYQMKKDSIFDAKLKAESDYAQAQAQHNADSLKQDSLVKIQAMNMAIAQHIEDSIKAAMPQ